MNYWKGVGVTETSPEHQALHLGADLGSIGEYSVVTFDSIVHRRSWCARCSHKVMGTAYTSWINKLHYREGFITSDKISAEMVMHDPNNLTKAYRRTGKFANSSLRAVGPTSAVEEGLSAVRLTGQYGFGMPVAVWGHTVDILGQSMLWLHFLVASGSADGTVRISVLQRTKPCWSGLEAVTPPARCSSMGNP